MVSSTRSRRGAIALALALWSQACVTHRPVTAVESLPAGTTLRVRSSEPLNLTSRRDTAPATRVCCTATVEGTFLRAAGDTLVLERGSGVAMASDGSRIPTSRERLTVVTTASTDVTVRQVDKGRTTLLVVGIAAALIGFAAFAASQIEYGFPPGDGTTFFRAARTTQP